MDRRSNAASEIDEEHAPALPSRSSALAACRGAIGSGPVLITGAAGVGKTWLGRLIAEETPLIWLFVDAAPGMTPGDLLRSMVSALGLPAGDRSPGSARLALSEGLSQLSADGRPAGLILDEAHLAGDEVLEEVRVLANRLGRPDGLAAILVAGQTPLARRFNTRPLAGFESRLAARIHLLPLDLDEATSWLGTLSPGLSRDLERVEQLHREAGGNPSRLLRLATRTGPPTARPPRMAPPIVEIAPPIVEIVPPPVIERSVPARPARASGPIVPAKPPLRVEDGLIEVGWDPEEVEAETAVVETPRASTADPQADEDSEEPIDDHYAALQAWDEWTRNQGRSEIRPRPGAAADPEVQDATGHDDEDPEDSSPLAAIPGLWAEQSQTFGPYSQLFSRLKAAEKAE